MLTAIPQYIEIRKNRDGQDRAYLAGTRIKVQDLVIYHERMGQSVEELAASFPQLSLAQIHGALAYYHEDAEAVRRCIREDQDATERALTALKAEGRAVDFDTFLREVSSRRERDQSGGSGPAAAGD